MLNYDDLEPILKLALAEDIGRGDVTSQLLIPEDAQAQIRFVAREPFIACGTFIPGEVYGRLDKSVMVEVPVKEGRSVEDGSVLAIATGPARALLTGERLALNLMQRMGGVATLTATYVKAVRGTKAIILDTRKTMPGLRMLDKYAVRTGGGQNHRLRLDDMVLIKDNHIALSGGIAEAITKARAGTNLSIEVECDTLGQVEEAVRAKPDRILLDNMSVNDLRAAVKLCHGLIPLEASGGVSLTTVKGIAETGVGYISVGKLTHSAVAVDIGADIVMG